MQSLKRNDTNRLIYKKKEIHRLKEWTYGCQGERGEGIVREFGMDMYMLLYLKWMTNKGLLNSTGTRSVLRGSLDGRGVWGNGYKYMHGWVPLLFTWNYHNIVNQLFCCCYPLQYPCLENPRDGGAWWAAICGVTQSQTRLKRLSSSSSSSCSLRPYGL